MIGESKMKKLIAIILCVCFVLCLTACNKDNTTSDIASDNSQITSTENQTSDLTNSNELTESSPPTELGEVTESSNPTESSKPTETNKPTHTHNYSAATCTAPAKCSCGATNGSALSHNWQDATCKTPKTCSVCNLTEGTVTKHEYKDGFCIICKEQDPDATNPQKSLKFKTNYISISKTSETEIETVELFFEDEKTCDINFNSYSSEEGTPNLYISYEGKRYYHLGGGGPTLECQLYEDIIVIKEGTSQIKIKLNPDGSLVIIQDDIMGIKDKVLKPQ